MSATLRTSALRRRRRRREKRRKLRRQLANASATERQALEAKLQKTYSLLTAETHAKSSSTGRSGA